MFIGLPYSTLNAPTDLISFSWCEFTPSRHRLQDLFLLIFGHGKGGRSGISPPAVHVTSYPSSVFPARRARVVSLRGVVSFRAMAES
jgi:hypothetical protein